MRRPARKSANETSWKKENRSLLESIRPRVGQCKTLGEDVMVAEFYRK